jgi:cell volume regulation protein A
MVDIDTILLVGAAVLIAAIIAARIGTRVGLPSLLLFLALGMAMGEAFIGIQFEDADLAQALGFAALVVILAEGGLTTKWGDIRSSIGLASLLATVGVAISVGLMAIFGYYVLHLPLWIAVLLGAVTSPTDAAAVFSVLRHVPIPHRLRGALEAESGLNDAPTVLLVMVASSLAVGQQAAGPLELVGLILLELVGGLAVGLGLGWLGVLGLRRVALPSSGLYPLAAVVWAVLAYGSAAMLHLSGFAAVYVCALVLGNAQLPHRIATRSFVEGIGWIAQIGLFVMLGLLASPDRIDSARVVAALAGGAFLTIVARPLSVLATAFWFGMPVREQLFLSWAGLRGAVPIVLATIPLARGVNGAEFLFDVVLVFVLVSTVVQGLTLGPVANWLGLVDDEPAHDIDVELAPLERIAADLLQVRIPPKSRLAGMEVGELRLPDDTVVSLIIRDGHPFNPLGHERIKVGDELLVVTPSAQRERTEARLRDLGRAGRLARWRSRSAGQQSSPASVGIARCRAEKECSAAQGWGGGRGLRRQADRLGLDRVRGLGVLVEAAVLVPHQHVHRTVGPLVRAYHGVLEEGLDEQHLGVLGLGADDHRLLDLLDGIGGQRHLEALATQRTPDVAGQPAPITAVVDLDGYLAGLQLTLGHGLLHTRWRRGLRHRLNDVAIAPPRAIEEYAEQYQQRDRRSHDAKDPTDHAELLLRSSASSLPCPNPRAHPEPTG